MFCVNCGKELANNAQFCGYCGTHVVSAGAETGQDKAVNFTQAQPAVAPAATVPTAVVPTAAVYANQSAVAADEKYCFSCGSVIKKAAEICPKCGVNQSKRSSITAVDVYCTSCGKMIKKEAAICPFCGVRQEGGSSGEKFKPTALLLCIFTACGHRFYTGKIGTAIVMLLLYIAWIGVSAGAEDEDTLIVAGVFFVGFLIWWIIDLVMICNGSFKDSKGNTLKKNWS